MSSQQGEADSALRHVAIIMDGNNRWAKEKGVKGIAGHQAGAERLQEIVEACKDHSIEVLTVFAFSSENWRRPKQEVKGLMSLFAASLRRYRSELKKQDVALRVVGRRDRFSSALQKLIFDVEKHTAGGSRTLVVAADYGGRWDITQAIKAAALAVQDGSLNPSEIDEQAANSFMCLSDLPEVDLLIRTGSETRISNFLLWQISYAELFFANCYWPDFDQGWFSRAIDEFHQRQRRFGDNPLGSQDGVVETLAEGSGC